jgi:FKBP12-rapamycin complex-associated protein
MVNRSDKIKRICFKQILLIVEDESLYQHHALAI